MSNICGRELVYAIVLMFGAITFGYVIAYPSPAIPQMQKEFHGLTDFETSFFNAVSSLAAIAGPFITAACLRCIGRRPMTSFIAIFAAISWILMLLVTEERFWFGIIVRALCGVSIGAFSAIIPMYIVELAPPSSTGFFGSLNQLGVATGIFICYIVGTYLDWRPSAIVGASIPACLAALVWLIPESPAVVQQYVAMEDNSTSGCDIWQKKWILPLFVCVMFMFFQQFSGVNAILTNLTTLFESAGVELSPGIASAISSIAQVVSVFIGAVLIEKLGRKVIWIVSFGGITLADLLYALCTRNIIKSTWFPIVVIFLFLLAFGLGAGPIPWFIVSEMFPPSVRPQASSVVSTSNWVLAFLVIEIFPFMENRMGDFGCFMLFAACSLAGTLFGLKYVKNPEDDGHGYEELPNSNQ